MSKWAKLVPTLLSVLLVAYAREGTAEGLSSLFNDRAEFAVGSAYPGGTNKSDKFPLLLRISESLVSGFSYARAGVGGAGLCFGFIGSDGKLQSEACPFEIEKWDTSGESRIWVLLPYLNNAAKLRVVMFWNAKAGSTVPSNDPTKVWSDYVAVWHMEKNDANGIVDSTGHGYDIQNVPSLVEVDSPAGSGLGCESVQYVADWGVAFPDAATNFTFSGWYTADPSAAASDFAFFDKKTGSGAPASDDGGWCFRHRAGVTTAFDLILTNGDSDVTLAGVSDFTNGWNYVSFSYMSAPASSKNAKNLRLYVNGSQAKTEVNRVGVKALVPGSSAFKLLVPGLVADEVRVAKTFHAEGWSKAEYAQVTNASFCTVAEVQIGDDSQYLGMFHDRVEILLTNLTERLSTPAAGLPLLVHVAEGAPNGFDPALAGVDGADVRFVYSDAATGACTILPSEVDTWDASGTSTFWVRIPSLGDAASAQNKLYMYWNPVAGATLPEVDSAAVWTGRNAVWHLKDATESAETGADGTLGENAYDVAAAAIGPGKADALAVSSEVLLSSSNYNTTFDYTNEGCAVSCWLKLASPDVQWTCLFVNAGGADEPVNCAARFVGGTTGDATALAVYPGTADTADGLVFNLGDRLAGGTWERLDVVISPERWAEVRVSGVSMGRKPFSGAIGSKSFTLAGKAAEDDFPGVLDELRVAPAANAETEGTILANVYQVKGYVTDDFDVACRDGKKFNEWLVYPSVSTAIWKSDDQPGTFDMGETRYGTPDFLYFLDLDTLERSDTMPTDRGRYQAVIGVKDGDDYLGIECAVDFRIEGSAGTGGVATPDSFAYYVNFTPTDFVSGSDDLKACAVLIRVREGSPEGFSFSKLVFGATEESFYSDVRFFDENGNALDYVIDRWSTDSGDEYGTLVWVKTKGEVTDETVITMCWGQGADTVLPENDTAEVWGETPASMVDDVRSRYLDDYGAAVTSDTVGERPALQLQNRWKVLPSVTPETRKLGEGSHDVDPGETYGGVPAVAYYDRSTGTALTELPAAAGEYRAIFKFTATKRWSELTTTINFRIVKEREGHDLGDDNDRILLANDDYSIADAAVAFQSYDDDEDGWGLPFWTHHEAGSEESVSDYDFTATHVDYNLFAGTFHEYLEVEGSATNRLWGLEHVRFGNLFNNGRRYPTERGIQGLKANQNYLPWGPESQRMLAYLGYEVGDLHRFAGTFLLQNVCGESNDGIDAQICSRMYEGGIGTIYFDVVNAFSDNVRDEDGNPVYAVVVEVATNMLKYVSGTLVPDPAPPADGTYPDGIWQTEGFGGGAGSEPGRNINYYRYADWRPVEMHPILFRADTGDVDTDCETLAPTNELVLAVTNGASCAHFYRVYVPVNARANARFRIRRTRIDSSKSLNPDASWIIVDNLICSKPGACIEIVPDGWFDPDKHGKQYLGWEGAFDPKFPGPSDLVNAKVKAVTAEGEELPAGALTALTLHYRWHYLGQSETEWLYTDMDPTTLTTFSPMLLPSSPGDVEFWFEGSQNFGYYTYANYSGTKTGVPGYSESFSLVTNGWDGTTSEHSFRVRDGKSDLEEMKLFIREPVIDEWGDDTGEWQERVLDMELVDDCKWRGYYQTTNAYARGIQFRFEMRNRETGGFSDWVWNTNAFAYAETVKDLPLTGKLTADGTNSTWAALPVDAATGHLLFQVDDSSLGLSIVHADYQNFNRWSDAWGSRFVATSKDDEDLPTSGVSPASRIFSRDFSGEEDFAYTNWLWCLDFEHGSKYTYPWYEPFAAGEKSEVNWNLGKGQFVYAGYRAPGTGTAFQMAGCSEGYVELSDQSRGVWPRGLESVSFNARIAQPVLYGDFSYVRDSSRLTNYTFFARVAFDMKENRGFTGNASLSLMAYYQRNKGCYEARWEQIGGQLDTAGAVGQATAQGQRLCLYRWSPVTDGDDKVYEATLLYAATNSVWSNSFNMPAATSLSSMGFMPMMISVYNAEDCTYVIAAVNEKGILPTDEMSQANKNWHYIAYCDNSASRLKSGAYGVQGASSDGYFARLQYYPGTLCWQADVSGIFDPAKQGGKGQFKYSTITATPTAANDCKADLEDEWWDLAHGRAQYFSQSATGGIAWGVKAASVSQRVDLWTAPVGDSDDWTIAKTVALTNAWGTINVLAEFGQDEPLLRKNEDVKLRLRTGGKLDGQRTDIIIDNVTVRQWRGKNEVVLFGSGYESPDNTNECRTVNYADPFNFIYTSGWIEDGALLLSPRRTLSGRPCSIRTPLFDGKSGRGQGLGLVSFEYRNVQTNARVLVQIATNVSYSALRNRTMSVEDGDWTTVATYDWYDLAEKTSATVQFGLREVGNGAVARIIVDPALVDEVADVDDTTAFGSIEIVSVTVHDEPPIDKGCWWGWNLRTLGDSDDTELKMFLPDPGERPSPGFSLALNNSTTANIVTNDASLYPRHMPFLQSPTFKTDVIGEVQFRARKYDLSRTSQAAEVTVYATTAGQIAADEWSVIHRFVISNTLYKTYSIKTDASQKYCALRLAVTGVTGVDAGERGDKPVSGPTPVRVLLDEVLVCEAIRPRLAFRNVHAFRSDLTGDGVVSNAAAKTEQPLTGESWGVQCELYAVMLADEIDLTKPPKVKLHWYEGTSPWGYENWKDLPAAQSGWLSRAADTDDLVYRSSYKDSPNAVIPQSDTSPTVVQYMLEVTYTTVDSETGKSGTATALVSIPEDEWTCPDWYAPMDYNADPGYGGGKSLSCFTILDSLSPGWAWINEINVYGGLDDDYYNVDRNCQYVEIAAPAAIDLSGWSVRMIEPSVASGTAATNVVAIFGEDGLSGIKNLNIASNYVFHSIACPVQEDGDRAILESAGACDGTWSFDSDEGTVFRDTGELGYYSAFAVQLVRKSGVVEHEIVVIGTNIWYNIPSYDIGRAVKYMNEISNPARYFDAGSDNAEATDSLSVVDGTGEDATRWDNARTRTPGKINEGQYINPNVPQPNGELVSVVLTLDQEPGGNIRHSLDGGLSYTNEVLRFYLQRGTPAGTNVVYQVDPWYEVGYVHETNGGVTRSRDVSGFNYSSRMLSINVGQYASNGVVVTAGAAIDTRLRRDYGLTDDNRYTSAVIKWLQDAKTLRGDFANDDGEIRLAEFWPLNNYPAGTNAMSLTEMYWLDMDPTVGGMIFEAGVASPPTPVYPKPGYQGSDAVTNTQMTIFMMISNKTDDAGSAYYGQSWSPYTLRGLAPGSLSTNYVTSTGESWTSVTFKVTGILANGLTGEDNKDDWKCLRWFVFKPDSFYQDDVYDSNGVTVLHRKYTSEIEVYDPLHSQESPAYHLGWHDWVEKYGECTVFYSWGLDERLSTFEIEPLEENNYYTP